MSATKLDYKKFLEKKPLYYKKIDYQRMPKIWKKIKHHFKLPKIIHLVGTNGKGTTGRYLAWILSSSGYKTGHYTSPHILKINERFWISKKNLSDKKLQKAHKFLHSILSKKDVQSLSYFEYTTLMAIYLFQECDYAIFEAGMGGEHDATAVFDTIFSIVTPIGLDHQEFLGDNIEKIATTKLKSIKNEAILAKQPHKKVYKIAKELSKSKNLKIYSYKDFIKKRDKKEIKEYAKKELLPTFLKENLTVAVAGANKVGVKFEKRLLDKIDLFGRCQKIAKNITIDVGHNTLAAKVLKKHFIDRKVVLIYNSYKDKEYKNILKILKPIIKRIEILNINNDRIEKKEKLLNAISKLGISVKNFKNINTNEEYLVFGSFSVVERFLKDYSER